MKPTTRLTEDLLASDTAHFCTRSPICAIQKGPGEPMFEWGVHIIDSEGRELLDGMSDLCTNLTTASKPSSTPLPSNSAPSRSTTVFSIAVPMQPSNGAND